MEPQDGKTCIRQHRFPSRFSLDIVVNRRMVSHCVYSFTVLSLSVMTHHTGAVIPLHLELGSRIWHLGSTYIGRGSPLRPIGISQASTSSRFFCFLCLFFLLLAVSRILTLAHLEGVSDRGLPFLY